MKRYICIIIKDLSVFSVFLMAIFFSGCQKELVQDTKVVETKPVFYPGIPEKPRIQYLTSFPGSEAFASGSRVKQGALDKFLFGNTPEKQDDKIKSAYSAKIYDGKLYVCDTGRKLVEVINIKDRTFGYLTKDRRMMNPSNIYIEENGTKYVADPRVGAVFAFDRSNEMEAILGKELKVRPNDIVIRGRQLYVTDGGSNQIVVMDKITGEEITRIGKDGSGRGEFRLICGIAMDEEENIYVTDKVLAKVTKFNKEGIYQKTIGGPGENVGSFARPKGISVDKEGRIWVVDAASDVAKIYNQQGRLLLYFGRAGNEPGQMNLPSNITLDYENVELFREYFAEGAEIEFLILVCNQFGPNKVAVYGFGRFPVQEKAIEEDMIHQRLKREQKINQEESVKRQKPESK